jgi:hypothetical protein
MTGRFRESESVRGGTSILHPYFWCNSPFQALDDPDNTVVFPRNKADFFR